MKNKKMIFIILVMLLLILWVFILNIDVEKKKIHISEIANIVESTNAENKELEELNKSKDETIKSLKLKIVDLENQIEQLKSEKRAKEENESLEYNPYLIEFKKLYDKKNWTEEEREKLIDLFLLIMSDHKRKVLYNDYLGEGPEMTIGNLIKSGEEGSVDYFRLFRLVKVSDGALSEMTLGFIENLFLEDAEALFKANYYGNKRYSTLSWMIFPYDSEIYTSDFPINYIDEMLSIYDEILMDDDLENDFKVYVQAEREEAEESFGR